jgi:plastocyanin
VPVAPAGFGTITGVVRVKGGDVAPVTKKIAGQEDHCGAGPLDLGVWRVDAASRGLADAHVVVEGATGAWVAASIQTLDNGTCVFRPAVLLMAPGDLKIANSDTIPHSAVFNTTLNPGENFLLPAGASRVTTLRIAERIEVTCSVHPWMHAVVIVKRTPFEALTTGEGAFELRGVPAGKHRLKVWHRCVGEVDAGEVDVPANGTATLGVEIEPVAGFRQKFR